MTRRWQRWAPPVVAIAVVTAYAVVPAATANGAVHPDLPPVTAAQLLTKVETAHVAGMSGTVHESADLGLPKISGAGSLPGLLSGEHTLTVAAAPGRLRVAVLDKLSERVLLVAGHTATTYDSTTGKATRTRLPAHAETAPSAATLAPQQAAARALAAIDPSTAVTIDRTTEVAGRAAYTLALTPKTTQTLVGRVELAVDAATGMPLRTAVYAVGHPDPVFSTAFTTISYAVPEASTFSLDVPATTAALPAGGVPGFGAGSAPTTIGTGWSTVTKIDGLALTADQRTQLDALSTAVPQGRLITTRLLSVLVTPDGSAYLGAVPGAVLQSGAGR